MALFELLSLFDSKINAHPVIKATKSLFRMRKSGKSLVFPDS